MSWYRTIDGHLTHAEGDLARVLESYGATEVDEAEATAEVESGQAQADADTAAAASAASDDPTPATPAEQPAEQDKGLQPSLVVDSTPYPPLSDEQQKLVDTAVAEESDPTPPRGGVFSRKGS